MTLHTAPRVARGCRDELGKTLDEVSQIVAGVHALQRKGIEKPTAAEAIAAAPPLAKQGGDRKSDAGFQVDNINSNKGGTSKSYLASRLNRDHPEIAEEVKSGKIKSIKAAARAAGIIKVKTTLEQLESWWEKATAKERREFLKRVNPS